MDDQWHSPSLWISPSWKHIDPFVPRCSDGTELLGNSGRLRQMMTSCYQNITTINNQEYQWEIRRATTAWVSGRSVQQDPLFVESGFSSEDHQHHHHCPDGDKNLSSGGRGSVSSVLRGNHFHHDMIIVRTRVQEGETDAVSNLGQTEIVLHCCQIP